MTGVHQQGEKTCSWCKCVLPGAMFLRPSGVVTEKCKHCLDNPEYRVDKGKIAERERSATRSYIAELERRVAILDGSIQDLEERRRIVATNLTNARKRK